MTATLIDLLAIAAATGAVVAVGFQTRHLRRSTQGQLLVEIRKLFDAQRDVSDAFRSGGQWHKSRCHDNLAQNPDVDAYLGLLEFCETLVSDGTVDHDTFMDMIGYRVKLIMDHPATTYRISDACETNWSILERVIQRVKTHPNSRPSSALGRILGTQPQGI